LDESRAVAERLDDITVSDEMDPEIEPLSVPASASGGETPRQTKSGDRGGSRHPRGATTAPGFFTRTGQFLRDTRAEMRRVSWPSANEVKNTTIITLIAVVFFALYLFGIDRVWAYLIDHLRTFLGG
jgi:preprotein translocase SecE subunit